MLHHFHIIFLESMFVHRIHHHTSLSGWLFSSSYLSLCLYPTCCVTFFSPTLTLAVLPIHLSFDRRRFPPSSENTLFIFFSSFHSSLRRSVSFLHFSLPRDSRFRAVLCVAFFFRLCFIFLHSLALLSALSVLRFSWINFHRFSLVRKKLVRDMHTLEQVDWSRMRRTQREIPSSYDELANLCFCNNNNMNGRKKHWSTTRVPKSNNPKLKTFELISHVIWEES